MCFAPQQRALFRHRNFQKWSEHGVFCTFWLGNVLRATTACNFSSLIWPGGSAPAALASLLFNPPEPQIIRKTQCFATFPPGSSFFWGFLFLIFFHLLFSSLTLPTCAFPSVHIVGSLTSKHPSMRPLCCEISFLWDSLCCEMWHPSNDIHCREIHLQWHPLHYSGIHCTDIHRGDIHCSDIHLPVIIYR